MSEAGTAVQKPRAAGGNAPEANQNRVTELRVSGHLMTLDPGLFCVYQAPGSPSANEQTGLPGVRISLPPGSAGRPDSVSISTFRNDGWLNGQDGAALVRVSDGPAQVLVTVYQAPSAAPNTAPRSRSCGWVWSQARRRQLRYPKARRLSRASPSRARIS